MKPLLYIMRKSFKNHLKELKKKPAALIGYIIMAAFFILMIVASFAMPATGKKMGGTDVYGAIVTASLIAIVYFGMKKGLSSGSSFFRMSDVNFVFTAPISPQKVLIYGYIKQIYSTLILIFFLIFQIPNMKNIFPLNNAGVIIILVAAFILMFSMSIISVMTYSIASRSKKTRANVEKILNGMLVLLAAGFLLNLFKIKDLKKAAFTFLNNSFFEYCPFVGWFKAVLMAAVTEVNMYFYINLLLVAAILVLMMFIMYKMNTDYYEDVLQATEYKEEMLRNKKDGKVNWNSKKSKVRKVSFQYKNGGAKAIFYRHLLEYKKSGYFFIDKITISLLAGGLIFGFFTHSKNIDVVLYFMIYMLFFYTFQGKWMQELSKPYIYMIPASSASKVFYATLADNFKNLVDAFALFIAVGVMFKTDPLVIILCAISYTTFGAIYIYGSVLSMKIFGATHSKNMKFFLMFILLIIVIAPSIVISVFVAYKFKNIAIGKYLVYISMILYNTIMSAIMVYISKGIFEKIEMQ